MSDISTWTKDSIKAKLLGKKRQAEKWNRVCNLAEEFGVFVYNLIFCGLSKLGGLLIRILMLIALAMSEFDVSVILPQQAYMLSADPWKLADDRMLAIIVSLFGHAISLKEQERRLAKDAVVFAPFDAEAVNL